MKRLGTAHRCTDRLPLATDALLKTVWECDCGARWICTDSRSRSSAWRRDAEES